MLKKILVACGLLIATMFAFAIWYVYATYFQMSSVAVRDVRQPEILVIGTNIAGQYTHTITIHVEGEIDGEATLSLMNGSEPYRVEKLRGKVNFTWGGDYYQETAEI